MSPFTTFANRLAWARLHRGLSMTTLAELSGLSQTTIHRYETAKAGASTRFVRSSSPKKLAEALRVNPIWLMTGDGDPFASAPSEEEYAGMVQQVSSSKKEIEAMRLWQRYTQTDTVTQALISAMLAPPAATHWVSDGLRASIELTKALTSECLRNSENT